MGVNVNLIRKLSNKELLAYLRKDSIYSAEAIEIAVGILENERNYKFSIEQNERITEIIKFKGELDLERSQIYQNDYEVPDIEENLHFPKLESKKNIIAFSFLSVVYSGYSVYNNLKILKLDSKSNVLKLKLVVLFLTTILISALVFYHFYGYDSMLEYQKNVSGYSRYRLTANNSYVFIYLILNFIFSIVIWDIFIKPGVKYRAKNQPNL